MRKKLIFLFLCLFLFEGQSSTLLVEINPHVVNAGNTYYVSTSGNALNDGLSESSPWSLQHAFNMVSAGDVVYIKAGNYGNNDFTCSQSGTETNPIQFIGYRTNPTPNDILDTNASGSSFERGVSSFNVNDYPTLWGNRNNGIGLLFTGDYIELSNFQIRHKERGAEFKGNYNTINNIIIHDIGRTTGYSGHGLWVSGDYSEVRNVFVNNGGAEGLKTQGGDFQFHEWNYVMADDNQGDIATDYYYLTNSSNNNHFKNCTVYRAPDLSHQGHGFVIKDVGNNNIYENCTVINTNFEFSFSQVANNLMKNCVIDNESNNTWYNRLSHVMFANGAHDNIVEGCVFKNGGGVRFQDWHDGSGSAKPNDAVNAGHDNIVKSSLFQNVRFAIAWPWLWHGEGEAQNNIFDSCTFDGVSDEFFRTERANTGTILRNCVISNSTGVYNREESDGSFYTYIPGQFPLNVSFENCHWHNNSFNAPAEGLNNTIGDPMYTDASSGDYTPLAGSPLINTGKISTLSLFDILGYPRDSSPDIGAFEAQLISINVTGIAVTPSTLVLDEGTDSVLTAAVSPSNATDQSILWSSSDTGIATVDQSGTVTGVSPGAAIITAETVDGGFIATTSVTVDPVICANPSSGLVPIAITSSGQHLAYGPCNVMDNDLNEESRWSSDGDGEWIRFDLGAPQTFDQLQIAFYRGNQRTSTFDIQVSSDAVSWTDVATNLVSSGDGLTLEDFDFPDQTVRYVRYLGHGNSNSLWNSLTEVRINYVDVDVTGIVVTPSTLVLEEGTDSVLTAAVSPSNATDQSILWSSSDTSIATVDQSGTVTGVSPGAAIITAETVDGGVIATTSVTIEGICPDSLDNDDSSVTIASQAPFEWHGAKTVEGVSNNTNGSDCALKIGKNATGEDYAGYLMLINLTENNITAGDQVSFSLDGNGVSGNARVIVQGNNSSAHLLNHIYGQGQGWSSYTDTITIPNGASQLKVWLYPNNGNAGMGYSLYDNLIISKIQQVICPDSLDNDGSSVTIASQAPFEWHGAKTVEGVSNNTNGSDCALKLEKNATGESYAGYLMLINLTENNIAAGDQVSFSLDGNGVTGRARVIVQGNNSSAHLLNHIYGQGQGWSSYTDTITIPNGASQLKVWLYPNNGNAGMGYSLYDNLVIKKVQSTSLRVNLKDMGKTDASELEVAKLSKNPSLLSTSILLPRKSKYTRYHIYNMSGMLVREGKIFSNQRELSISTDAVKKGVYIITLIDNKGNNKVLKLIKE